MQMHLGMSECHLPFLSHCDLTSDLVFRIMVFGAFLLSYLRKESPIWCVDASWDNEV